ncbi:TIGR04282 family arsenosugar biosynthesis glycosyltransferase [Gordonia sp. DT101]|uniref:TIGR04282 family arsenosugar biosynthesis glycosyltransferase n=1 Tax=Gordonia sp. DT101 TaxID=3416545 RepID=UPI003CF1F7C7
MTASATRNTDAVLLVAKAPIPGAAKTRLIPEFGPRAAADLAAAALIDTIRTACTAGPEVIVAMVGDPAHGARHAELADLLHRCTVIGQRGDTFGERLRNAHVDAAALGVDRVLQIGMDTPQVTRRDLKSGLRLLRTGTAVLGPAVDGGWWALGLVGARGADVLPGVPMSTPETRVGTEGALRRDGLVVRPLRTLVDVDRPDDVAVVARLCPPQSAFATAARTLDPYGVSA